MYKYHKDQRIARKDFNLSEIFSHSIVPTAVSQI